MMNQVVTSLSFRIISSVGTARSKYIEAIQQARKGKISEAKSCMKEGTTIFLDGHRAHAELIALAGKEPFDIDLLLMHAEDQLMGAENFKIVAEEFIYLYEQYHQ